jgi:hypothetical protein
MLNCAKSPASRSRQCSVECVQYTHAHQVVVLLMFAAITTVYFHDFWNLPDGPERVNNMFHTLKNLSIVGALLMLAAWPRRPVIVASRVGAALTPPAPKQVVDEKS